MAEPKVYIILLNYMGWKDTVECIESIQEVNRYRDYQIVTVDNRSPNDSVEQMIAFCREKNYTYVTFDKTEAEDLSCIAAREGPFYEKGTVPLVFIQAGGNSGFPAGNNTGMRYGLLKGDGDYYWVLNNDTVVKEDTLGELVKLAEEGSENGITGSKLLFYHKPGYVQTIGNEKVSWKGIGTGRFDGVKDSEDLCGVIETRSIIGASMLVKREVIEEIGLMDENYFMYHEESDWCTRARRAGFRLLVNCRSVVLHKEGASTERKRIEKSFFGRRVSRTNIGDFLIWGYYGFRNEIYFVRKNFPREFFLYLFIFLPKKYGIKTLSVFLFNDDHKIARLYLLTRALFDGVFGRTGKRIDPEKWREKYRTGNF